MDDLVERLDDNATQSFVIASTSHSKIIEYRKQLKIKAVQAAKDKGIYLTEAVGEKLGEAITITEPSEGEIYNQYSQSNMLSNNALYLNREQYDSVKVATEADFKKIKLRFEVNVLFALK